jgi:hypothetical protein
MGNPATRIAVERSMRVRIVLTTAAALLTACGGLRGSAAGPLAGPTGSPSPTGDSTAGADGDIAFVLEDTYEVGERVEVRIVNNGDRAYKYNSTGYEACELTYSDQTGREFIIPPGTHCDLVLIEQIKPGETVKLFEWDLDECTKDRWGCVEEEGLPPGTYTLEGTFRAADGGPPAHAEATFRIVE